MWPKPCWPRDEGELEAKAAQPYLVQCRRGPGSKITLAAGTQILGFKLHANFSKKKNQPKFEETNLKACYWYKLNRGITTNSETSSRGQCLPLSLLHINTQSFLLTSMATSKEARSLRYFTRLKSPILILLMPFFYCLQSPRPVLLQDVTASRTGPTFPVPWWATDGTKALGLSGSAEMVSSA